MRQKTTGGPWLIPHSRTVKSIRARSLLQYLLLSLSVAWMTGYPGSDVQTLTGTFTSRTVDLYVISTHTRQWAAAEAIGDRTSKPMPAVRSSGRTLPRTSEHSVRQFFSVEDPQPTMHEALVPAHVHHEASKRGRSRWKRCGQTGWRTAGRHRGRGHHLAPSDNSTRKRIYP